MKRLLSSIAIVLFACGPAAKPGGPASSSGVKELIPALPPVAWFRAAVDVMGRHVSGLLVIKRMDDGARRVVFTAEAGTTLFDFEYAADGAFAVRNILKQLDRKPVIKVLRDDFALLLGLPFRAAGLRRVTSGEENYHLSGDRKGVFIVTDTADRVVKRIGRGTVAKQNVTIIFDPAGGATITHHTFPMQISLTVIPRE